MKFMNFELKKYWVFLIVIILIILYYGRNTTFEGMLTQQQKDTQLGMALNYYDMFTNALQIAKDANDTLTENYIQFVIIPHVEKEVSQFLDNADPKDIERVKASNKVNIEKEKQQRKYLGIQEDPSNGIYLALKDQAIRQNYKYSPDSSKQSSLVSTSAFFDNNQTLYNSLTAYNSAYYNYVSCVEGTYNTATYDSSYNILNGIPTFTSEKCNNQANHLNNTYTSLNTAISNLNSSASNINRNITSIDKLKTNEKDNKTLRSELDMKLQDLYSIENSPSEMSQLNVDSTTFAFILWAIMASSVLFFIFYFLPNTSSSV
jgi:paraquat-inducible protein B